jgi:hypothetical protein
MRGTTLLALSSALAFAACAACGDKTPPPTPPTATPPSSTSAAPPPVASASAAVDAGAPRAPDPPVPDEVKALAPQHAPPVYVGSEEWLVFLGPPQYVRTALSFDTKKKQLTLAEGFPTATRVLGSARSGEDVLLLLESVAALDQPAGLRAVVAYGGVPFVQGLHPHLDSPTDTADLARRVAASTATPLDGIAAESFATMSLAERLGVDLP